MSARAESFEKIYSRHWPRMLNFANRLCHDRDDAEDLAQEAFLRAFRAYDNYENERPIENWLMRILQNVFFDVRRKQKRRPVITNESSLPVDLGLDSIVDPSLPFDEIVQNHEAVSRVETALSTLSEENADLLRMAYVQERPFAEIAKQLGVPPPTVRSRLYRARLKIRSQGTA